MKRIQKMSKILCMLGIHLDPLRKRSSRCDRVSCSCGKEWFMSGFKLVTPHPKEFVFVIDKSRWWESY